MGMEVAAKACASGSPAALTTFQRVPAILQFSSSGFALQSPHSCRYEAEERRRCTKSLWLSRSSTGALRMQCCAARGHPPAGSIRAAYDDENKTYDVPIAIGLYSGTQIRASAMEEAVDTKAEVVAAAEAFAKNVMGSWDGSHDPFHAYRVRNLSLSLASEEGLHPDSQYVVELAALLHDVDDYKYASNGPREFPTAEEFLVQIGVETEKRKAVLTIIRTMGFKEELAGSSSQTWSPELAVVQDADRLDAMGAIGIGRTFTYGGSRGNALHDPAIPPRLRLTKAEYMNSTTKQTTVNHFHEKLLKLKDLMKTQAGKRRAEARHKFMEVFLSQFHKEWDGDL